jgi:hypothetical protein
MPQRRNDMPRVAGDIFDRAESPCMVDDRQNRPAGFKPCGKCKAGMIPPALLRTCSTPICRSMKRNASETGSM